MSNKKKEGLIRMFGKVINKVGVRANNQNSAYYGIHNVIKEFRDNLQKDNIEPYHLAIGKKMFTDALKNQGFTNEDIRYMTKYNRDIVND